MDNIKVGIRIRPLLAKDHGAQEQWVSCDKSLYPKLPPSTPYHFDDVFSTKESTNTVYEKLCRPIVEGVMEGINGTIFAYGQTASGKTFTMMGDEDHPGVILQASNSIFSYIQEHPEREHLIRASYLEIYNESLTDLLNPRQKLRIRETRERNFVVQSVTEIPITAPEDIYEQIELGERNRSFGKTNANEHSSRSHTIFKLTIESRLKDEEESDGTVRVASLSLVDLAGSERVSQTGATGKQFKEGACINLSLHILGRVINKLSEGNIGHVPYRESKLTSILQPSIGGNSKTCIICTISPCEIGESHSTLQFASSAKTIKNKPIVNEVVCGEEAIRKKLKWLEKEYLLLQQKFDQGQSEQERESLSKLLSESERKKAELEERNKALEELIVGVRPVTQEHKTKVVSRRQTMCPSLLSRDSAAQRGEEEHPLGLSFLHKPTTLKKQQASKHVHLAKTPSKVVSFAPTPEKNDVSFDVKFSPDDFVHHLDRIENGPAVSHITTRRRGKKIRGRPSFLPNPNIFEDSLEDCHSSPIEEVTAPENKEEVSRLVRRVTDLERENSNLAQELAERDTKIQELEDNLVKELEEKLLDKSQILDQGALEAMERQLEEAKASHAAEVLAFRESEKRNQQELAQLQEQLSANSVSQGFLETMKKQVEETKASHAAIMEEARNRHQQELAFLQQQLDTHSAAQGALEKVQNQLEQARASHDAEVLTLRENEKRRLQEIAQLQEQLNSQCVSQGALEAMERQLEEAKASHAAEVLAMKESLSEQLTSAQTSHAALTEETRNRHQQELAQLQEQLNSQSESQGALEAMERQLEEARASHAAEVLAMKESLTALQAKLISSQSVLAALTELSQHQEHRSLSQCQDVNEDQVLERAMPSSTRSIVVDRVDVMECYEQEIQELSKKVESKAELVAELLEKNAKVEAKLVRMRETYQSDLHDLQDSVTSLRAGLDKAGTTIKGLVSSNSDLEVALRKKTALLEEAERELAAHQETIRSYQEEKIMIEQASKELSLETQQSTVDSEQYESLFQKLHDSTENYKQLEESKAVMEAQLTEEKLSLVRELEEKESLIVELNSRATVSLESELEQAMKADRNADETESLKQALRDTEQMLKQRDDLIAELESRHSAMEKDFISAHEELKGEAEALVSEKQLLLSELDKKVANVKILQLEMEKSTCSLQQEIDLVKSFSEEQLRQKDELISEIKKSNFNLEQEIEHMEGITKEQLEHKDKRISEMQTAHSSLEQEIERMEAINGEKLQQKDELISEIQQAHSDLEQEIERIKKLNEEQIQQGSEMKKSSSEALAVLQADHDSYREEKEAELELLKSELQSHIVQKEEHIAALVAAHKQESARLQSEIKDLRNSHQRAVDDINSMYLKQVSERDDAIQELECRFTTELEEKVQSQVKAAIESHGQETEALKQALCSLQAQLRDKDAIISDLESQQIEELKQCTEQMKTEFAETKAVLNREIDTLRKNLSSVQDELTESVTSKEALSEEVESLKQLNQILEEDKDKAEKEQYIAEQNEYEFEIQVSKFQKELKTKESDFQALEKKLSQMEHLDSEVVTLKKELDSLKELNQILEEDKDKAEKEQYIAEQNEYEFEIQVNNLERKMKAKEKEFQELEEKLSQMQAVRADSDKVVEEEQAVTASLEIEKNRAVENYRQAMEKVKSQEGDLEKLKTKLTNMENLHSEVVTLKKDLDSLKELNQILEEDKDKAEKEQYIAEQNEYEFEIQVNKLQKELKSANEELGKVKGELARLQGPRTANQESVTDKENVPPQHSNDVDTLKGHIKEICRLRTADQASHKASLAELKDELDAVRRENKKLIVNIQQRPAPSSFEPALHSDSGVVTDLMYRDIKQAYTKLEEKSDAESKKMMKYRHERNVMRAKYMAVEKLCSCRALERAQADPNFQLQM